MSADFRALKESSGHKASLSAVMAGTTVLSQGAALSIADYRKRKVALITGVTGQDGSYLAELLLEKGYDVHGM